ncbi:protein of unknown function [Devosia crocina]|uniref:Protein NO VEIN C-terminal domain-containing protein n=1 Tax=Devosia crocina TaxID=429728 RepID=A0A1I7NB18_9HYPH|nr:DUF3883 domain-containing protein [Devosia crocina]SFV31773.1 protein of unknown function [Devosia crocina]
MAEQSRPGENWSAIELDAIIADYFGMLGDELAKRPYVKTHHRLALMHMTGRSAASIEFKHRNISAVLQELGLPWIWGYKPAPNYQDALVDAVDRYLSGHREIVEEQPVLMPAAPKISDDTFTDVPVRTSRPRRPTFERLVRKFDPVERDFRNRRLGRAGEEFVVKVEHQRLIAEDRSDLANRVRWVAMEDGDGAGFDVRSFDRDGRERLIEVKTTNGAAHTPFFMTRNELEVAEERSDHWYLYRVYIFAQQPKIFTVRPPLGSVLQLNPETWRAEPAA